jgi:hypothetical protein
METNFKTALKSRDEEFDEVFEKFNRSQIISGEGKVASSEQRKLELGIDDVDEDEEEKDGFIDLGTSDRGGTTRAPRKSQLVNDREKLSFSKMQVPLSTRNSVKKFTSKFSKL